MFLCSLFFDLSYARILHFGKIKLHEKRTLYILILFYIKPANRYVQPFFKVKEVLAILCGVLAWRELPQRDFHNTLPNRA